mgnify:CR=1 FL=1
MDMNKYLDVFIEEAREHLDNMNRCLLGLERSPADREKLDEIFRSSHTLKGMAGTMGFEKVSYLTHEMENILQDIKNEKYELSEGVIDVLFKSFDVLEEIIAGIAQNGVEKDIDLTEILNELKGRIYKPDDGISQEEPKKKEKLQEFNRYEKKIADEAKRQGFRVFKILIQLNEDCVLKSARAFVVFNNLEKYGEIIKTKPQVEDIEDEKFDDSFTIFLVTDKNKKFLEKILAGISELRKVEVDDVSELEEEAFEEKVSEKPEQNQNQSDTAEPLKNITKSNINFISKLKTRKTVRVDIERLDNLMNLVSELIIIKTRLEEIENKKHDDRREIYEAIEYMERITSNLHDAVMKVRMVPIAQVFNRFPRMVRDLAKELNKEIELRIKGEETELDRTVIDEIGDPLIHLIRNAVDHGIESTQERVKLGKPKKGIIDLLAYHDGNNVVIEIRDDGRGINKDKILEKVFEKGLFKKTDNIDQESILQFLFLPGFSTASKVTGLSGRGVGLDVVKTKIESLGGNIEVKTRKMQGTQFIIRLPLTLAIIQALLIKVGSEKYAIPLSSIRETVTINSNTLKNINNHMVTLFRNEVLPIVDLKVELGIESEGSYENELTVVIVKKGDKSLGLVVDDLVGQQEIVIKTLGNLLKGIDAIAGATILGNGNVALILDTNSFFKGV